jgi:fumarate hydratase class II
MRIEKDSMGFKELPQDVYYGIQTARAVENFPISGWKAHPSFIKATVHIKKAAAVVHKELGLLPGEKADAIIKAADEILSGKFLDQFVVDVFQAGAGTSHNMNANEVIANRALELLNHPKGDYEFLHPNDHVNMGQSTNDVVPTAIRIATLLELREFLKKLDLLEMAFTEKAAEFDPIIKSGRTHLQDATPIRLGQEFSGYATSFDKHRAKILKSAEELLEIGLGGTAVGTGLNTHPAYREKVAEQLSKQTDFRLKPAHNFFEAMQSMSPFTGVSSALRNLALDVTRIANDFRLLASGPNTGLAELVLPAVQPGSSIMPGKVNPVLAEMLNMVCFYVIGSDASIAMAAQAGQLELNVMMPLIAYLLPTMIQVFGNALQAFGEKCVKGLKADAKQCEDYAEKSLSIVTALNPYIGYLKAAEIAKESKETGKRIRDLVLEKNLLPKEKLDEILDLQKMTEPGIPGKEFERAKLG